MVQFLVFLEGQLCDRHKPRSVRRSGSSPIHHTAVHSQDGSLSGLDMFGGVRRRDGDMTAAVTHNVDPNRQMP